MRILLFLFRNLRVAFCLAVLAVACASTQEPPAATKPPPSGYVLGPDDQILIRALEGLDLSFPKLTATERGRLARNRRAIVRDA